MSKKIWPLSWKCRQIFLFLRLDFKWQNVPPFVSVVQPYNAVLWSMLQKRRENVSSLISLLTFLSQIWLKLKLFVPLSKIICEISSYVLIALDSLSQSQCILTPFLGQRVIHKVRWSERAKRCSNVQRVPEEKWAFLKKCFRSHRFHR